MCVTNTDLACDAVPEMGEGLPKPACRSRLQTTRCCCVQKSGLAAVVTPLNVHDKHALPRLLHGQERRVYGDSAYTSQQKLIASKAPYAKDFTNQRTRKNGLIDEVQRGKNGHKSKTCAPVEQVFTVVKRLWGFTKVRYRGLKKNAGRTFTARAPANLYLG